MSQKSKKLWVELEVRTYSLWQEVGPGKNKLFYGYSIRNPRTGLGMEQAFASWDTEKEALNAGLAYLRRTYNTGKPQKR